MENRKEGLLLHIARLREEGLTPQARIAVIREAYGYGLMTAGDLVKEELELQACIGGC